MSDQPTIEDQLAEARKVSALLGEHLEATRRVAARAHEALSFYATETDGGERARVWLAEGEPRPATAKPLTEMTEAEFREDQRRRRAEEPEPVHTWFSLTYSSYLVLQRSILQSMPVAWQRRFIECIHELEEAAPEDAQGGTYIVNMRDAAGRFVRDPYSNYDRGRRRVPLRVGATL